MTGFKKKKIYKLLTQKEFYKVNIDVFLYNISQVVKMSKLSW